MSQNHEGWEWYYSYPSESAIDESWPAGDYTFVFNDGAESVTVTYTTPSFSEQFMQITYPMHDQTRLELNPRFTRESVAGLGDAISIGVFEWPDVPGQIAIPGGSGTLSETDLHRQEATLFYRVIVELP